MGIYITKYNFVWLDVTNKIKYQIDEVSDWYGKRDADFDLEFHRRWSCFELYAIHEDDTKSSIEFIDEIEEAVKLGLRIGIAVGHLPKPQIQNWQEVDKRIIDGHWWVKFGSQKFGQSN